MKEGTERKEEEQAESGWGHSEPGASGEGCGGHRQPSTGKPRVWQSRAPELGLQGQQQMTGPSATDHFPLSRFLKTRLFKAPGSNHWGPGERPAHTPST